MLQGSNDWWERHPYAGLVFTLAYAGFALYIGISDILQGSFLTGSGMSMDRSNDHMITSSPNALYFYAAVVGFVVTGLVVLVTGIRSFHRHRKVKQSHDV